jgi:hypothetical protein
LDAWMDRRPILAAKFKGFWKQDYIWEDLHDGSHQFGQWWYGPLRKSVPFEEKLCSCPSITNMVFNRFDRAVHSTNFYSLMNILNCGLKCGPWEVKKKPGIFTYKPMGLKRARKSSGYRTYSDLLHNGYFWGVVLEIALHDDVGQRNAGSSAGDQTVTPEDETFIIGVWFHCVHVSDHFKADKNWMWCTCDDWNPDYEIAEGPPPWA